MSLSEIESLRVENSVLKQQIFDFGRIQEEWMMKESLWKGKLASKVKVVSVIRETLYKDLTELQTQMYMSRPNSPERMYRNGGGSDIDPDFTYLDAFRIAEAMETDKEESNMAKMVQRMKDEYEIEKRKLKERHEKEMVNKMQSMRMLEKQFEDLNNEFSDAKITWEKEMRDTRISLTLEKERAIEDLTKDYETKLANLTEYLASKTKECEAAQLRVQELELEVLQLQKHIGDKEEYIQAREAEFEEIKQQMVKESNELNDQLKQDLSAALAENKQLSEKCVGLGKKIFELKEYLDTVQGDLSVVKSDLALSEAELSKVKTILKQTQLDLQATNEELGKERSIRIAAQTEIQTHKDTITLLRAQIAELQVNLQKRTDSLQQLEITYSQLHDDHTKTLVTLDETKETLKRLYNGVLGKEKEVEYNNLKARVPEIERRMRLFRVVGSEVEAHVQNMVTSIVHLHDPPKQYTETISALEVSGMLLGQLFSLAKTQLAELATYDDESVAKGVQWSDVDADYGEPTEEEQSTMQTQIRSLINTSGAMKKKLMRGRQMLRLNPRAVITGEEVSHEMATQMPSPRDSVVEEVEEVEEEVEEIPLPSRDNFSQTTTQGFYFDKKVGNSPRPVQNDRADMAIVTDESLMKMWMDEKLESTDFAFSKSMMKLSSGALTVSSPGRRQSKVPKATLAEADELVPPPQSARKESLAVPGTPLKPLPNLSTSRPGSAGSQQQQPQQQPQYSSAAPTPRPSKDIDSEFAMPIRKFVYGLWEKANNIHKQSTHTMASTTVLPFMTVDELGRVEKLTNSWDILEAEVYALLEHISALRSGKTTKMIEDEDRAVEAEALAAELAERSRGGLQGGECIVQGGIIAGSQVPRSGGSGRSPPRRGKRVAGGHTAPLLGVHDGVDGIDVSSITIDDTASGVAPTNYKTRELSPPRAKKILSVKGSNQVDFAPKDDLSQIPDTISMEYLVPVHSPSPHLAQDHTKQSVVLHRPMSAEVVPEARVHATGMKGSVARVVQLGHKPPSSTVSKITATPTGKKKPPPPHQDSSTSKESMSTSMEVSATKFDTSSFDFAKVPDVFPKHLRQLREEPRSSSTNQEQAITDVRAFTLESKRNVIQHLREAHANPSRPQRSEKQQADKFANDISVASETMENLMRKTRGMMLSNSLQDSYYKTLSDPGDATKRQNASKILQHNHQGDVLN
eukprot:PhF_6_TR8775/c1_g1_i1/m.13894